MKYLFIDGGFLDALAANASRLFGIADLEVNYSMISAEYQRCFYYDALTAKKPNQTDEEYNAAYAAKEKKFSRISLTPSFHTREGITRNRTGRGARLEQKGVDILLAIDVYKHAARGGISEAHIMTTDVDFFPLFEALRDTGTISVLHCQPNETSPDLKFLADRIAIANEFSVLRWAGIDRETFFSQYKNFDGTNPGRLIKTGTFRGGAFRIFQNDGYPKFLCHSQKWNSHAAWSASTEELLIKGFEAMTNEAVYLD